MDWTTQIEKRKNLIVGGILLIALCALIVTSLRSPVAMDPFWHLQMGKDWLENGLSPWVDHYSFTYYGHEITNPPVIFQGLLHLTVSQFGMQTGFLLLKLGFFLLTMGAAFLLLRLIKAPTLIYAAVIPMIVLLLQLRAIVRPELFSYTLSIVALMFYFRAGNSISTRKLIPMVALMLIWSNYHSSILGYIIFFGFFLDCAVAQLNSRAPTSVWLKWLAWGGLILAVGFLNPSVSHPIIGAITFSPEWKTLILEYLPPAPILKSIAGVYILILFAALTPVMAYRQRQFGFFVIWALLTFSALSMRRMVTPAGIIVVMLAAQLITSSKIAHRVNLNSGKVFSRFVWVTLLASIAVTLYSNVERARYFMRENRAFLGRYPVAIADYMSEKQMSGRIFNAYGAGGYLIYRLSPRTKVYIDGRTGILYPLEHLQNYENVSRTTSPETLREELDKYAINHILWKHTQAKHDLVQEMGGFGLDFLDARYVLYTRGPSNFPLLGKLLSSPQCWRPEVMDELNAERRKMDTVLPDYSGLFPFADLIIGYANATDGKAYFDTSIEDMDWFDEMRRFAGFRFLETGYYDLVLNLLGGTQVSKPKDYLASALAMVKKGDFELASQIIEEFSNLEWPRLKTEDIFIHYQLYQLLETQRTLTPTEQEQTEGLKKQLVDLGYSDLDSSRVLNAESFCSAL